MELELELAVVIMFNQKHSVLLAKVNALQATCIESDVCLNVSFLWSSVLRILDIRYLVSDFLPEIGSPIVSMVFRGFPRSFQSKY